MRTAAVVSAALLLVALAHQGKIKTIIKLALVFGPRPLLLGLEENISQKSAQSGAVVVVVLPN